MEFFDFFRFVTFHDIDLARLLFGTCLCIVENICAFNNAGHHLEEAVAADKRIDHRLENISALDERIIIIGFKRLIGGSVDACTLAISRSREIIYDVRHQAGHISACQGRAHDYRDDITFRHTGTQRVADLIGSELLAFKISFHKLFARLGNCFDHLIAVTLKIFFGCVRNRTLFPLDVVGELASFIEDDIDIAGQFTVLTQRHVQRSDFLTELLY